VTIEIRVPQLPESVADATLVAWHKQPGEAVKRDENLADLETDKVVLEVPAPANGVLKELKITGGTTVTSGQVLAIFEEGASGAVASARSAPAEAAKAAASGASSRSGAAGAASGAGSANGGGGSASGGPSAAAAGAAGSAGANADASKLSPSVRRLVEENKLDPGAIPASGRDGRLTKSDVVDYLNKPAPAAAPAAAKTPAPAAKPGSGVRVGRAEQRVTMTRLRQRIAQRLVEAQSTQALLTSFNEVDLTAVNELRAKYKDKFEKQHGVKLGFMSFFVKAAVHALKQYPVVNASIDGADIVYHGYYDVGVAVGSERGLVVPIIRDADQLSLARIEQTIADFGKRAKDGKITLEELTGGTFSISNGGVFGSMLSTPIINPPQSAILGIHATKERPVVENGQVVIRPMNYLALSYDHRIIDGREAVLSLVAMKEALEDPARLVLDI
jgi:2-oxoglutarate dehydrogenase E2 component (dihydrolipoamide succinyltransferase)